MKNNLAEFELELSAKKDSKLTARPHHQTGWNSFYLNLSVAVGGQDFGHVEEEAGRLHDAVVQDRCRVFATCLESMS